MAPRRFSLRRGADRKAHTSTLDTPVTPMHPPAVDQTFLQPTSIIDADHALVIDAATAAVRNLDADVDRARAIFEWVRDEIPHSWDIRSKSVTCTASDVLRAGTGICFAKSHLLAAMCRAVSLPAGLCYQRLRADSTERDWVLHGLNAVFLPSLGRWVRVDPRGNKPGVDAQFCLTHEQLAFPPDTSAGELIYDGVHADADPAVVTFLTTFTDLAVAWPHLPEQLTGAVHAPC